MDDVVIIIIFGLEKFYPETRGKQMFFLWFLEKKWEKWMTISLFQRIISTDA